MLVPSLLVLTSIITVHAAPQGRNNYDGGAGGHTWDGNGGGDWGGGQAQAQALATTSTSSTPTTSPVEANTAAALSAGSEGSGSGVGSGLGVDSGSGASEDQVNLPVVTQEPATAAAAPAAVAQNAGVVKEVQSRGSWSSHTRPSGGGWGGGQTTSQAAPVQTSANLPAISYQNVATSQPASSQPASSQPASSQSAYSETQPGASASAAPSQGSGGSGNSGSSGGAITNTCGGDEQMIEIVNNSGKTLYVNAGGAYAVDNCGEIPSNTSCTTCQGAGQTGSLRLGLVAGGGDCGTWIESNTVNTPCTDISIISGYTVPVLCTAEDGSTTGFTNPLCSSAGCKSDCEQAYGVWNEAQSSCFNPTGTCNLVKGPDFAGDTFFNRVKAEAYFMPYQGETSRPGVTATIDLGYSEGWRTSRCVAYPQY